MPLFSLRELRTYYARPAHCIFHVELWIITQVVTQMLTLFVEYLIGKSQTIAKWHIYAGVFGSILCMIIPSLVSMRKHSEYERVYPVLTPSAIVHTPHERSNLLP